MQVQHTDEEPIQFDHYDPDALHETIYIQHNLTVHEEPNEKEDASNNVIIDDLADDPPCTRQSNILHTLYIRGHHNCINTITTTQKFNALHPIIKVNATDLFVYRLRNMQDF